MYVVAFLTKCTFRSDSTVLSFMSACVCVCVCVCWAVLLRLASIHSSLLTHYFGQVENQDTAETNLNVNDSNMETDTNSNC